MAIHADVARSLEIHSDPLTRAAPGAHWVRGWDDREKPTQVGAPPSGNQWRMKQLVWVKTREELGHVCRGCCFQPRNTSKKQEALYIKDFGCRLDLNNITYPSLGLPHLFNKCEWVMCMLSGIQKTFDKHWWVDVDDIASLSSSCCACTSTREWLHLWRCCCCLLWNWHVRWSYLRNIPHTFCWSNAIESQAGAHTSNLGGSHWASLLCHMCTLESSSWSPQLHAPCYAKTHLVWAIGFEV